MAADRTKARKSARTAPQQLNRRFRVTQVKNYILLSGFAAVLAACSSTPVAPPATAPVSTAMAAPAPAPATTSGGNPVASSTVTTVALPAYLDPSNPISRERSVFFDFDDFTIKSEYSGLVARQGQYLASHPNIDVKVEGNADERGSAEYNLALGQKRAEAVVRTLKTYGVKDSQAEAISWGKEKPRALGHDEAAWAQNRRADIQYPQH
jgi:peptidoglycan-associated lipoprotein